MKRTLLALAFCAFSLAGCGGDGGGGGGTCDFSCSGGGGGTSGAGSGNECQGICNTQCGQAGRSCGAWSYTPD